MKADLCKIVIVDDEFIIRQGIVHFLDWEKEGFTIVGEASNGQEALELIEKTRPHIILCDIVMPIMDGVELSKIIKQRYPAIKVIVLSSYSDFDNVKQMFINGAADYILKPTLNRESLITALNKVAKEITDIEIKASNQTSLSEYLSQLLLGFNNENINDKFLDFSYYYLLAVNCKRADNEEEIEELFEITLSNYFDNNNLSLLRLSGKILVLVFGFNKEIDLENRLTSIVSKYANNIFILSNYFNDIKDIKSVYENSILKGFNNCFYLKKGNLICTQNSSEITPLNKFDMHSYNEYLYLMQLKEALQLLKEFVYQALEDQCHEKELKSLVGNTLYSFIVVLEERNLNSEYIRDFKLTSLSALDSSDHYKKYYYEFNKVIDDLNIIVENYQIELNQDVMNQIIKYIHEHYQETITLYDLADYFGFSYSYLSSYFNERSDLTFNECLNKIRTQKAAELLRTSNISISDIGYQVGFSDHSYFCKVFKKQIGVTPSVYRKGLIK
ncbi:response regulator transcription factor [Thomasclavelia sp.]